jgi:hypothetical protein
MERNFEPGLEKEPATIKAHLPSVLLADSTANEWFSIFLGISIFRGLIELFQV